KSCAVAGDTLPNFNSATAFSSGIANGFDLSVVTNTEHVGIRYTGFLQAARDGLYRFYTTSDDGSRLFVGEPTVHVSAIGSASFPQATPSLIGQPWKEDGNRWVEEEGKVTFASEEPDILKLEVMSET